MYVRCLRYAGIVIAVLLVVGFVLKYLSINKSKFNKAAEILLKLAVMGAICGLFVFTVFTRGMKAERGYNFVPFQSYVRAAKIIRPEYKGNSFYTICNSFYLILLNYALMFPIGLFFGLSHDKTKIGRMTLILVICSALVETIQYLFGLGYCELDDVINNVIGGILGYVVAKGINRLVVGLITKHNNV